MNPTLLLGLCGRARHGKDFVASVIHKEFVFWSYRVFTSSVSLEVLKDAQAKGLIRPDITRAECTRAELDILVKHGHEGRAEHPDKWLRKLEESATISCAQVVIVSGIRFPNEITWLRSYRGVIGRVKRYNDDGSVFISPDRDPNDPMETCIERVVADYEITATTGQESWLENQARGLAAQLLRDTQKDNLWKT